MKAATSKGLIGCVANRAASSGRNFNPHVTTGVAPEPLPEGDARATVRGIYVLTDVASVYQLGTFGTARKELKALVLKP